MLIEIFRTSVKIDNEYLSQVSSPDIASKISICKLILSQQLKQLTQLFQKPKLILN